MNHKKKGKKKKKRKKDSIPSSIAQHNTLQTLFLNLLHGVSIKEKKKREKKRNQTTAQKSKSADFRSMRSARIRIEVHSVPVVVFDEECLSTIGVQEGSILLLPGLTSHLEQDDAYVYIRKTRFSRLPVKGDS